MALKDQVWQVLKSVSYPGYSRDIVSFGLVKGVTAVNGEVTITLAVDHLEEETQQTLVAAVRDALEALPEVQTLQVEVGDLASARPRVSRPASQRTHIRRVLAVGSGKGGVGKSTVAINLAVALAQRGLRAGLVDADVYGPNVPRMLGVDALPAPRNGKLIPAEAYGVHLMSIGFLVRPDQAVMWRGPMTDKLVRQFLTDVAWLALDVLVVDLPPGTGDVAMSLAQHAQPDGAIVVVTPQGVALDDARKAVGMFHSLQTPVLGLVENMSYFVCSKCEAHHDLFGHGGGQRLARALGLPLLGEVPLEPAVREGGDEGMPAVLLPDSQAGAALQRITEAVWTRLEQQEQYASLRRPPDDEVVGLHSGTP